MDFDALFNEQLDSLKNDGNYRYFAELERKAGKFPRRAASSAEAASAAAVEAAEPEKKDNAQTLKVGLYIFGWYFLNAVFGECHPSCPYRRFQDVA